MARPLLSQTLTLESPSLPILLLLLPSLRRRAYSPGRGRLAEIDDAAAAAVAEGRAAAEDAAELVRSVIARRIAPWWLPFVPGSSFWVPLPPKVAVMRSLPPTVATMVKTPATTMNAEERLALNSSRGWPSSAYFVEESNISMREGIDLEMTTGKLPEPVKRSRRKAAAAQSDDEE
ncbi:uncharacterized protein LOC109706378 isoform X2 [Ananas comosus]|uniref:Uncharacterized protein LOC109706378 isoform X2 n=1 Tax=Ananas comosus TaxID=4615 RepID=A0A6P5EN89_ANACO|nr:uncharacterized protein LOC109706378 isoform X2 [Ananas comosus]